MARTARITVVGSFAVGLTLRAPRFPVQGETLLGKDFDMGPGGKGSNQAVGIARLGGAASFVGLIGTDHFGDMAVDLYAREGVDTLHLTRTPERNTGVGFIVLNPASENFIILDPGANGDLSPAHVDAARTTLAASDLVASVLEIPPAAAARAARLAREAGVPCLLNPAPAQELQEAFLADVDVLTPNETEARILLGLAPDAAAEPAELADALLARGPRTVVITLGAQGALVATREGLREHVPGVAAEVVDTTGAGDAFNAGLAVALAEGRDTVAAVRFAVHCGALAVTQLGVIPGLPHRQAVEDRLAEEAASS